MNQYKQRKCEEINVKVQFLKLERRLRWLWRKCDITGISWYRYMRLLLSARGRISTEKFFHCTCREERNLTLNLISLREAVALKSFRMFVRALLLTEQAECRIRRRAHQHWWRHLGTVRSTTVHSTIISQTVFFLRGHRSQKSLTLNWFLRKKNSIKTIIKPFSIPETVMWTWLYLSWTHEKAQRPLCWEKREITLSLSKVFTQSK